MKKSVTYNVGIYLRLSKEDGDNFESESITNQRKIINDYIKKNDNIKIYDEYVDDGYTGANFDRPNFKRLLKDIENKKVNMVITKNLARLGRNYIETGNYIEKYFPDHRVRYIAILDNVDNFEESYNNDFIPLKSVFNEKHCRDTSIAVKKTKRARMKDGFYACTTAPFGYKKDPENPGKLIIDEESSKTVRKIFELKLEGYTYKEIVNYLDKNNYATPAQYMNIKGLESVENKNVWRRSSVTRILANQVYIGHCIRGKTQNISYKSKNRTYIRREECIITKNTHEPIITEEMFEKVHDNNKFGALKKNSSDYLLKNLAYCKNCGAKLVLKRRRQSAILYCRNNDENTKLCINGCKINYEALEEIVIEQISNIYNEYMKNNKVKDNLYQKYTKTVIAELDDELKKLNTAFEQLKFRIASLYNQRLSGKLEEETYIKNYNELSESRRNILDKIADKEKEIKAEKDKLSNLENKKSILNKLKKLSKEDFKNINIREFIDKIDVFENEVKIYFSFCEIVDFTI